MPITLHTLSPFILIAILQCREPTWIPKLRRGRSPKLPKVLINGRTMTCPGSLTAKPALLTPTVLLLRSNCRFVILICWSYHPVLSLAPKKQGLWSCWTLLKVTSRTIALRLKFLVNHCLNSNHWDNREPSLKLGLKNIPRILQSLGLEWLLLNLAKRRKGLKRTKSQGGDFPVRLAMFLKMWSLCHLH